MRILISNDDGVDAPGIKELAQTMQNKTDVTVVAPHKNRSGSSSALTLDRPLRCERLKNGFFSVNGTPCDCIHLGSHRILESPPDMVISGINRGPNLGDDVLYSGTVAAAMEGRNLGYTAVAISLAGYECLYYQTASKVMLKILNMIRASGLPSDIILNVNVPDIEYKKINGFKLTRLGCRHRADTIVPAKDARGKDIYWIGPPSEPQDVGEGTDFWAIQNNFVSITPLVVDLTAKRNMGELSSWVAKI